MQGIVKQKKYYREGELVWIKEDKTTGTVLWINTKDLKVAVRITKVNFGENSGGISSTDKILNLWDITKFINPRAIRTLSKAGPLIVPVKYLTELDEFFKPLEEIAIGDWIDLRCAETVELNAGDSMKIRLGLAMDLPDGYEAHIRPRSSTFDNFGVTQTNSVGVVDNSYAGDEDEWKMPVLAHRKTTIIRGERVAQFRIIRKMPKTKFVTVDTLGNKSRGGFGSTGTK